MADLNTEIVINLSGNLQQKAQQYSSSMKKFSESNSAMARTMRGSFTLANRGLDALENRYTALIATVAGGAMANRLITQDRRLSRLAVAADLTKDKTNELYKEIEDISRSDGIRIDPNETLGGIEVIMEKIGDLDFALKNTRNIAIVAQATGARGEDVGAVLTQLKTLGIETQDEVMAALDTLNLQGKSGSFTLGAFAANGERILAAYAATGRKGVQAAQEVGAALQVIRKGVGSDDQAVTAYERLMTELTDPTRVKNLQKYAGINVFDQDALKNGVEIMRPLPELMKEITVAAGGFSQNWKLLNFGDEAKRAFTSLNGELKKTGEVNGFEQYTQILGDGTTTMKDAEKVAGDYTGTIQTLGTALNQLANRELAKPMTELADAVKSLTSEDVDRWLELGKNIAYGVAGMIAARKALGIAKDLKTVFGKKGGVNNNSDMGFGLGVQPVYVTNMGTGGMGGGITPGLPDSTTPKGSKVSLFSKLFGNASQVAKATTVGYALSIAPEFSPINVRRQSDVDTKALPNNFPVSPGLLDVWDDLRALFSSAQTPQQGILSGNPNIPSPQASESVAPTSIGGVFKVEVDDKRARVSQAQITGLPGATMEY